MPICTFFGHRDCPAEIMPKLREILIGLIEKQSVNMFYVGNNGGFDRMVHSCLHELEPQYSEINYAIVLEHMPKKRDEFDCVDYTDTTLPEGIEKVHPRFAIAWRNKWMLRQADYVVVYVTHSWGGAAQFTEMAEKQGKTVIKL